MKKRPARATAYLTVALLVLVALRYTPELPDAPAAAGVLQQVTPRTIADFVSPAGASRTVADFVGPVVASRTVADFVAPVVASRTETLNRGETLIGLFRRVGVSDQAAKEIVRAASSAAIQPRYLQAGMPVDFTAAGAGEDPTELVFHLGIDRLLRMRRSPQGWVGVEERLPWTTDTVVVGGSIRSTLYQAMDEEATRYFPSRAKDELTWALADIFEYRVDMSRDLQVGDQFKALVERSVGPRGITKVGKVLAASFTLSGSEISAVLFDSESASPQYYDATGRSLRAAFLRAPLEFRRISSNFGLRRHPILGRLKAHKGTDYAANSGTPVRAIGDATVVRAGWAGGYGNVLELRHRNGYVTRYGHLRGFAKGIHSGVRVNIAQTVAFVGTTGMSTAPHLHFEVLIGGVQRDSRVALKSVAGDPILRSERGAFEARRQQMLASLAGAPGIVRLASR